MALLLLRGKNQFKVSLAKIPLVVEGYRWPENMTSFDCLNVLQNVLLGLSEFPVIYFNSKHKIIKGNNTLNVIITAIKESKISVEQKTKDRVDVIDISLLLTNEFIPLYYKATLEVAVLWYKFLHNTFITFYLE